MTYPSDYKPGQVLTAADLNASFDGKTENSNAAITGGYAESLDHVYVIGTTDSVNPQTGALIVTGGVGVGMQLQVGGKITAGSTVEVKSAAVSNDAVTGALIVAGGIGAGGAINSGGHIKAIGNLIGAAIIGTDTTNAVDPVTGALTTAGGAGIAKDLYVGGSTAVGGGLTVQGNATVAGTVNAGAIVIAPGGGITFGDGSIQVDAPIPEAPSDGKKYGRKDVAWVVLTDIPEAPLDAKKYGRDNAAWVVLTDIPEAPSDGKTYGRKNATWENTGGSTVDGEITLLDGSAANEVLPAWAALQFNTVSGTAFTKLDANSLLMNGDGPTVIQIKLDMFQAHGASVVFGYTIGTGAAEPIELGRIKLESDVKVRVEARYNVLLHNGDHFHLWISSDVASAGFAWSGGLLEPFLNQTVGIPEAPSDGNQYSRRNNNWQVLSASGMWRGDTPPVDVDRYPQWYNTTDTTLYVWYDDGDSAQWVICVPVPGTEGGEIIGDAPLDGQTYGRNNAAWVVVEGGGGGGGGSGVWIGDAAPADTAAYPLWWNSTALQLLVWYNDGTSSQWVDTNAQPDTLQAGGGALAYPLLAPDGLITAPSYAFASQPDMGLFSPADGVLAFASKGWSPVSIYGGAGGASDPSTKLSIAPLDDTGSSMLEMWSGAQGNAFSNRMYFYTDTTGTGWIERPSAIGEPLPCLINFPAGVTFNSDINAVGKVSATGIRFPAQAVPAVDPNTLDDYEEGTWVPSNPTTPWTVHEATYRKIGSLVFINCYLTLSAQADPNSFQITGLPFNADHFGACSIGYQNAPLPAAGGYTAMASGPTISVYDGGGFATFAKFSGAQIYLSGCYATN